MIIEELINHFENSWQERCVEIILLGEKGAVRRITLEEDIDEMYKY